jgi:hypothetical protein
VLALPPPLLPLLKHQQWLQHGGFLVLGAVHHDCYCCCWHHRQTRPCLLLLLLKVQLLEPQSLHLRVQGFELPGHH